MNLDRSQIVTCPFCGKQKELISVISGDLYNASCWSDDKILVPLLPVVSPVQKCKRCGKYFLFHKQSPTKGEKESFVSGQISYEEWKEAYLQFKNETDWDEVDIYVFHLSMIQAYNDHFYRSPAPIYYIKEKEPSIQEFNFFVDVVNSFFNSYDFTDTTHNEILQAELLREIAQFKKAEEILHSIDILQLDDYGLNLYNKILAKIKVKDKKVFKVFD